MSDKHTDALDLEKLEALARAATPGPWYVQYGDDDRHMCMTAISKTNSRVGNAGLFEDDDLIAVTFHQCYPAVNYEADDLGEFNSQYIAAVNPATVLQLIAKIRATEGQAQTSALGIDLSKLPVHHIEGLENGGYYLCTDVIRAAQLADSTAPGAPVAYIHSVDLGKVCASVYSPAEFKSWPLGKKQDISPYVALYAAPTAQQSLTAGGAVPDTVLSPEEIDGVLGVSKLLNNSIHDFDHRQFAYAIEDIILDKVKSKNSSADNLDFLALSKNTCLLSVRSIRELAGIGQSSVESRQWPSMPEPIEVRDHGHGLYSFDQVHAYARAVVEIAAAPLPQVQREALGWVNVKDRLPEAGVEVLVYCGYRVLGSRIHDVNDPENHNGWVIDYENGMAGPITHWAPLLSRPDQQPVTPSGALADNDGGEA